MSYSYKFPTTLPIDITFFNAESVSPVKLNEIFSYLKVANTSIEIYLGNGIDFNITDNVRKKLVSNLSNIIGDVSGNVYMPYNYFGTIYTIYKNYCSTFNNYGVASKNTNQHAIYNAGNDSIEIVDTINIPIMRRFENDVRIGLWYSLDVGSNPDYSNIECTVHTVPTNTGNDLADSLTSILNSSTLKAISKSNNKILNQKDALITANTYISHIVLSNIKTSNVKFNIHSLYLFEVKGEDKLGAPISLLKSGTSDNISSPLNSFYAVGKDHKALYICKQPCKWSSATYNNVSGAHCAYATGGDNSGVCIGNTYDIFIDDGAEIQNKFGVPVCGGSAREILQSVDDTLVPFKSGNSGAFYKYETSYDGIAPEFYVLQSPLLTYYNKQHSFKYHPLSMVRNNVGITEQSECYIYNYKSTGGVPLLFGASVHTTIRPDIVKVYDKPMTVGDNNKYIFISGDIGISQMISSMLEISSMITGRSVAVYAD